MKKNMKKIAAVAMGVVILGSGFVGSNGIVAKQLSVPSTVKTVQAKNKKLKPKTFVYYKTIKKGKGVWVEPSHGIAIVQSEKWKSSNPSVAAVTKSKPQNEEHYIKAKKKGKAIISCVATGNVEHVPKGSIYKWVITVK